MYLYNIYILYSFSGYFNVGLSSLCPDYPKNALTRINRCNTRLNQRRVYARDSLAPASGAMANNYCTGRNGGGGDPTSTFRCGGAFRPGRTTNSRAHSTCRWNCVLLQIYYVRSCDTHTHTHTRVCCVYILSHEHTHTHMVHYITLSLFSVKQQRRASGSNRTCTNTRHDTSIVDAIALMRWMDWMWMCGAALVRLCWVACN